ncbi:MAG: hypothetical protein GX596_05890 [Propionibacterium sp.]|nr:hypothetical protein [Propionibacterium sp.]
MDQLLYGSADDIAGRATGGWGVIRETPGIEPSRRDRLSSLASVYLPQTMPQFPSAMDLERRSRRFRSRPLDDGAAVCMSVEAGPDHTGRPGNVISHCAAVEPRADLRTIDWFFSPGWVLPHGAGQVARAELADALEAPSGWSSTADWLRADPMRILKARWVVSAGVAALQGERSRLLIVAPTEEGARWLSAILWMLPPDVADAFQLLVGEDARTMAEQQPTSQYIAVIGPDVVVPGGLAGGVVDTTGEGGDEGLWGQMLADLLLQSDDVAADVFARRDELLERYKTDGAGEPFRMAHALKVAWLTRPGGQNFGQERAIRDMLAGVGPTIRRWPELRELADFVGVEVETPSDDAYGIDETHDLDDADGPYHAAPAEDVEVDVDAAPQPSPVEDFDEVLAAAQRLRELDAFPLELWARAVARLPEARRRDVWLVAGALAETGDDTRLQQLLGDPWP